MIKVLFFAALREQLNCAETQLNNTAISTVADVKQALLSQHPEWQTTFNNGALLVAVNQQMATLECSVKDDDEVAFFPPVTGG